MNIFCEHCGQRYAVPEKLGGKQVKCKKCAALITIPRVVSEPDPAPSDDPLRGFFEQELPSEDAAQAVHQATIRTKTRSPRAANIFSFNTVFSLLRGLMSAFLHKPLLTYWAMVPAAFLVAVFWGWPGCGGWACFGVPSVDSSAP